MATIDPVSHFLDRCTADWRNLPDEELMQLFAMLKSSQHPSLVKNGWRYLAAYLFGRNLISLSEYLGIFQSSVIKCLTLDQDSSVFKDLLSGNEEVTLARHYSRAKHGGLSDIKYIANVVTNYISDALDNETSHWRNLFERASKYQEPVVLMTTGWRNVRSSSNVIFDIAFEAINLKLSMMGLTTVINVKLPRIAPPCENYAQLSQIERERVSEQQDHVIPDKNFYQWRNVHVIFGDDSLITGATADKIFYHSMKNGAASFQAIYPIAIDPLLALTNPSIEETLNSVEVTNELKASEVNFLLHEDYIVLLRTLRLLLAERNTGVFRELLHKLPKKALTDIYIQTMNNNFHLRPSCGKSVNELRRYLNVAGMIDPNGFLIRSPSGFR